MNVVGLLLAELLVEYDFKKRLPIVDALAELKQLAILDGEIVALDEQGRLRFEWLVNRGR